MRPLLPGSGDAALAPPPPFEPPTNDGRRRYFDAGLGMTVVQVLQGDYYVTQRKDEVLTTVLGSCISACIRDPWIGCGGMNHFLLPDGGDALGDAAVGVRLRYGAYAMERLIDDILSRGGRRERLEVKIFGGGNVVAGLGGVGHRNADFVESYLATAGLTVSASHLRGDRPRRLQYVPRSGRVRMRELDAATGRIVATGEARRRPEVRVAATGAVEVFD